MLVTCVSCRDAHEEEDRPLRPCERHAGVDVSVCPDCGEELLFRPGYTAPRRIYLVPDDTSASVSKPATAPTLRLVPQAVS